MRVILCGLHKRSVQGQPSGRSDNNQPINLVSQVQLFCGMRYAELSFKGYEVESTQGIGTSPRYIFRGE